MSDDDQLVRLTLKDQPFYLTAHTLSDDDSDADSDSDDESEIAATPATLQQALDSLSAFAQHVTESLRHAEVSKINVEFGCEFALESGRFVAVIGKASAKSTVKVGLEWTRPTP